MCRSPASLVLVRLWVPASLEQRRRRGPRPGEEGFGLPEFCRSVVPSSTQGWKGQEERDRLSTEVIVSKRNKQKKRKRAKKEGRETGTR